VLDESWDADKPHEFDTADRDHVGRIFIGIKIACDFAPYLATADFTAAKGSGSSAVDGPSRRTEGRLGQDRFPAADLSSFRTYLARLSAGYGGIAWAIRLGHKSAVTIPGSTPIEARDPKDRCLTQTLRNDRTQRPESPSSPSLDLRISGAVQSAGMRAATQAVGRPA
jgi:hypothetical protein